MNNITIYKKTDLNKNLILIKTLQNFEDFKDGIRIFQLPPYNEVLSDDDCKSEYDLYLNNGIVFGCYVNDELAGLNCILNDVNDDYSIDFFDRNKVAYYSGLAVKNKFRKRGFGKLLINQTQKYLENLKLYDYCFARILCEKSMSEGIFKINGFNDAYYKNELIIDNVTFIRNDSNAPITDKRKYMVKVLNKNGIGWYKKGNI